MNILKEINPKKRTLKNTSRRTVTFQMICSCVPNYFDDFIDFIMYIMVIWMYSLQGFVTGQRAFSWTVNWRLSG